MPPGLCAPRGNREPVTAPDCFSRRGLQSASHAASLFLCNHVEKWRTAGRRRFHHVDSSNLPVVRARCLYEQWQYHTNELDKTRCDFEALERSGWCARAIEGNDQRDLIW